MIRVDEVLRLALPAGTVITAGESAMSNEVTWATRPRPAAPAFVHLSGGELVLMTDGSLKNLDERMTLEAAIKQLATFGVAAIGLVGKPTAKAITAANSLRIPLLRLPDDADLAQVEREAVELIAERRRDSQRRGNESSRRLMEMAISGESLTELATAIAEMAGLDAVIETRDGRLVAMSSPTGQVPTSSVILPLLERGKVTLLPWIRLVANASPADPPTTVITWDDRTSRAVTPIIGKDGLLGVLSLLLPGNEASADLLMLASRGAAACALVLARERAAAVARQELELNVLDEILDGALRSEVSLIQQARRLGHDLDGDHVAIMARFERQPGVATPKRRSDFLGVTEEILSRLEQPVLWRHRNQNAEIIWPVDRGDDARTIGERLHREFERRLVGTPGSVSMSVGSVMTGMTGIRESHQQARQALSMGRKLNGPGSLTVFDELGIYRLLFAVRDTTELRRFHDEALERLIDYDEQNHADLVRTLGAYFEGRCGPKETAAILGIHRNTVLYRLERIAEISGLSLDDPHVRLRLHLAYCAHVALFSPAAESRTMVTAG